MGKHKQGLSKVDIDETIYKGKAIEEDIKAKEKQGYHSHSITPPLRFLPASGIVTQSHHEAQLQAYQEDAAKLPNDAKRIEFWLNKAEKMNDKASRAFASTIRHNHLLNARDYLREAIALGSVTAAIKHKELIQFAIGKNHYNFVGAALPLNEPFVEALVALYPLVYVKFHHANTVTSASEKEKLEEVIQATFPQEKAMQIRVIKAICEGIESRYAPAGMMTETITRNMITSYLLHLPALEATNNNNNNHSLNQ